jgi:hypothetical protein
MQVGANSSSLETIVVSATGIVTSPHVLGGTPAPRGCILAYFFQVAGLRAGLGDCLAQPLDGSLVSEVGRIRIRRDYILLDGGGQALAEATVR